MDITKCPDCGGIQYSLSDKSYVSLYNTGWCCDKKRWEKGELTLEEFEKREELAVKQIVI